ncbi:alpha/beta hydrolase [Mycolicibacterium aubagnense]|uniref:DUF1023 domain-containing protein n=1 Tax=Mycolicibacterium aubagnense TaxID=319707 RepID=A0ABM7IFW3_9MYCO|nr:alpha/beta hydrolase [Mycolicibacterium aubagnense]WGI32800.1 alpha/beta hydrolase [Mycolicibacterium aubagnense]BBX85540.1 hypothetical protein MAUB_34130 [Mycolicibacterium aubagnense]
MAVTVPQVEASRPESLTESAAELGGKASRLAGQIDAQRATIDGLRGSWQGTASDAAVAKVQPTMARMQQIHDALGRAQAVLQAGGTQLSADRINVVNTVSQLTGQGWQVSPDGTVGVRPGSPLDQYAKASTVNEMKVLQLAATNSVTVKTLLARFDTTDRQLSQNLRTAVGGLDGSPAKLGIGDLPQDTPPYDDGSQIPTNKSPEDVKKWWDSLPPDKQAELRDKWPEKLGNLNGVPIVDRDKANRKVWERDLHLPDTIAESRGVTRDEVLAHPELYGLTGPTMDRYKNACKIQDAFNKDATARDADRNAPEIFLVKYDPEAFGGKGSAAIALGNPDTAKNTTVMVSGFTTSVAGDTMADGSAVNMYNEANKADPGSSTAVLQWMGYDAPGLDARGVGVAEPFMARDGAQILAADVNALAVTHEGAHSHTTVIGHSYGSTTVADAAAGYGMRADDVVLVGCPGTDLAKSAADFHLPPGGHLYVGAASSDPVTNFGQEHINVPGVGLGADPAMDGYGSTRFHAEVPGVSINPIHDHSEYFTPGSESLFSIADIVSGHGDALEHDGMTAGHRHKTYFPPIPGSPIPPVVDPELVRVPHNDHRHKGKDG